MMAAYQPQTGAMHSNMAPHGHPAMTPGGQPMTPQQMQQMGHPGVSAAGAPHVTQGGAMMGMQPGANAMAAPGGMGGQHPGGQMSGMPGQMGGQSMAGAMPNAHTAGHMTPQAALQHQQQQQMLQQQMQQHPQHNMQQQQLMMQRQQQIMAQRQANGMMQQGGMQNMSPQQLQQLQQNNPGIHPQGVQLPPHMQQQQLMAQIRMQQQAQQNQIQQQQQQQFAMQQANSQQGNQGGHPGQQGQPGAQQQHPGQQQMRPQSRMANPNEQSQAGPQQNAQQGQQPPQQQQQQQQAQANAQQGQQQNQQQQGQQQQTMTPQQLQHMQVHKQRQMQHMQQVQQQQRQLQASLQQSKGVFILKVMLLADQLSNFNNATGKDITHWHSFVEVNFAQEGRFVHSFLLDDMSKKKTYEVQRATIARYFQSYFDSHAQAVRLHTEQGREVPIPPNRHSVSFANATFTVFYPNGARLELSGNLNVLFAPASDLIECMEFNTTSSEDIIARTEISRVLDTWSPSMNKAASPKTTKNKLPKAQSKMQSQFEGLTIDHFPKVMKGDLGVATRVQSFLEIGETMNIMSELVSFAQERKMRPEQALDGWIQQYESEGGPNAQQPHQQGTPQINLPPNGVPVGNRTPSMQHMQMPNAQGVNQFQSPSVSNLNLPMQNGIPMNGSPQIANNQGLNPGLAPNMNMPNSHSPSPHQGNMAAPPMMPQHSQQGTNSSAASTNTSPNVNNKRRRSTVKLENDEGGGETNVAANRVKPSPRIPKKAKPGGA